MLPDTPVFGPRMRYVGMRADDLVVSYQALSRCAGELAQIAVRLERADVPAAVKGAVALAIGRAVAELAHDVRALSCEVVTRIDQLNRATGS
jgi:hypothetical protein